MKGGYTGKMLFVNLTSGSIEEKELTDDVASKFIGGYGIGAKVLYEMMKPGVDPLGPDNVIGFITGPLNGTGAFIGGRYIVVCKSPVNGGWNDANSGGFFGPELKKAGYDAVFVSGASDKPVYIWINDGKAEIRDASKLWGKDTVETLEALIEETGERRLRASLIGPAGERLSMMAAVMNEEHRAAGRGGPGAVMGSKKLKAVAVRGTMEVPVADPEKLREANRAIREAAQNGPMAPVIKAFGQLGTGMGTGASALSGDTPVKNWGGVGVVDFGEEKAHKLDAAVMDQKYRTKKYACANCIIGCGADYEVKEGKWPLKKTFRPEYETAGSFGTMLLNDNAESIIKCNDICNRYGLDTISTGCTIAWATECYENGLITKEETGGIELTWGNADAIVDMCQAIADDKGFGKILALGSAAAAAKLGKGAEYLVTVRGIELPMHDPKLAPGYARTYYTDPTPGRHVKGGTQTNQARRPDKYVYEGTGDKDLKMTSGNEILQLAGLCLMSAFTGMRDMAVQLMEPVTGMKIDEAQQIAILKRTMGIRHAFNLREGLNPFDIKMPKRAVGEPPQAEGPLKGVTVDYKLLAENFFEAMEWDVETGKPKKESLEALGGMEAVIRDLYGK
ncbi:MAG: aldehyde ferredoxin oxidoreductase family protein [Deltaproteobacteria bacterium]|nr:aldehyde ferredoxin oxidoreductase family protein [Deltaproteobacteria bacterium]